jgi:hypothetical protein
MKNGLVKTMFETFKKVDINIPLLDIIQQMPPYAKFLKELCTHKKKFQKDEKVELCEEVSAIIQRRLPPKLQDPGSFTLGCRIGGENFNGALMDLGASINLMPYDTFRKLAIGDLKPTSISLQLADQSSRVPMGIVEDVLIMVDKFILPADFVVLDIDGDPSLGEVPIILGRPFMATAGVKINVRKGTIRMKVLGEKVKLQVSNPILPPKIMHQVFSIKVKCQGNSAKQERVFGALTRYSTPSLQDVSSKSLEVDRKHHTCTSSLEKCMIKTTPHMEQSKKATLPIEQQQFGIKSFREIKKRSKTICKHLGGLGSSAINACVGGGGMKAPS